MRRFMMTVAAIAALGMSLAPAPALAEFGASGSYFKEGSFTMPAGTNAVSEPVALEGCGVDLLRVVVWNAGSVTTTVAVASRDLGVSTALDTFALPPGAALSRVPPGSPVVTDTHYMIPTGTSYVATAYTSSVTNWARPRVRDLTFGATTTATNVSDQVFWYRIFGSR